jgi:hypothetical protein
MRYGYQRKMNQIFIARKAPHGYSNGIILVPAPLECCIVRWLFRRSNKLSNFSEKGTQRHDGRAGNDMYIIDSSMCIEHIINPVLSNLAEE